MDLEPVGVMGTVWPFLRKLVRRRDGLQSLEGAFGFPRSENYFE